MFFWGCVSPLTSLMIFNVVSSRVFYTVFWSGSVVAFFVRGVTCGVGLLSFTGIPLICIYSALNSFLLLFSVFSFFFRSGMVW